MKKSYPTVVPAAKGFERDFGAELDQLCRAKISELVQAYLCFEVDEALQRARYQRSSVTRQKRTEMDSTIRARSRPAPARSKSVVHG